MAQIIGNGGSITLHRERQRVGASFAGSPVGEMYYSGQPLPGQQNGRVTRGAHSGKQIKLRREECL